MTLARNRAETRSVAGNTPIRMLAALFWLSVAALAGQAALAQDKVIRSHGLSIFGDLKYPSTFRHFDYVNPDAPKGGEISSWAFGSFDSLSPYILKGNAAAGSSVFFDTLMTGGLDEPDAMYGLIAQTIEYPENREWIIFHLRPEAKFWDGTQITADDVVFSFETLREKGRPSYKLLFRNVVSSEALDALTVKFTFDPDSALREMPSLVAGLPVFSKAYYTENDFAESSLREPLGSGPYRLKEADPGRFVIYERNPDYWARDLPVNVGANNFDTLRFEYFADYSISFEAFKGGNYNFREEYSSKTWAKEYNFPAVTKGYVKTESLADGRPSGTQGFWFNMRRDKFSDPRVREALAMAFNFEWSNQSLFHGQYVRTDSFWENSKLQASGLPGKDELALLEPLRGQIPDSVFTEPAYTPPESSATSAGDRRNLRKAGKLLDAAGWKVDESGLRRNEQNEPLRIEFLNDGPTFDRVLLPYVENLKRLGVDAKIDQVDSAQSKLRQDKFDFDIVTKRFSMSQTPGMELRDVFGSDAASAEGSGNVSGLNSPAIDHLITQIENAKSRDDLTPAVKALDRVLRAMHIWVPQWYKGSHNIAYLDVFSRPYGDTPPPNGLGEYSIWWFDEQKAAKVRAAGYLK